jgi:hypothetical protein
MQNSILILNDLRHRKIWHKMSCHAHRSCSRTAATVRSREGLVKVKMKNVKSHVTRTDHSDKRIHVRSVIIKESSALMDKCRNLPDVFFEESESVRIGHHDAGDGIVKQRLEIIHIDKSVGL